MFSKSCQYGLQGVLYIAVQNDKGIGRVSLKEISDKQDMPYHFLSKILQQLVKEKVLSSTKGANGGFSLNMDPDELKLLDIVTIIDEDFMFDQCAFGLKECSDDQPCPIHHKYVFIREEIRNILSERSITEHVQDIKDGHSIISITP